MVSIPHGSSRKLNPASGAAKDRGTHVAGTEVDDLDIERPKRPGRPAMHDEASTIATSVPPSRLPARLALVVDGHRRQLARGLHSADRVHQLWSDTARRRTAAFAKTNPGRASARWVDLRRTGTTTSNSVAEAWRVMTR